MKTPPRILGLVGILDAASIQEPMWANWRAAFAKRMPQSKLEIARKFFTPFDYPTLNAFADETVAAYDDGVPTLLFGYSLGGVVAHHIAPKFTRTPIVGVVSVCSPLAKAEDWWDWPLQHDYPALSFGGLLDTVVPYPLTKREGVDHESILTDHLIGFSASPSLCDDVVADIATWLARQKAPATAA